VAPVQGRKRLRHAPQRDSHWLEILLRRLPLSKLTSHQVVNILSELVAWYFSVEWLKHAPFAPFWQLPVLFYLIALSAICPIWASKL
jgi:hypothetical protein